MRRVSTSGFPPTARTLDALIMLARVKETWIPVTWLPSASRTLDALIMLARVKETWIPVTWLPSTSRTLNAFIVLTGVKETWVSLLLSWARRSDSGICRSLDTTRG